MAKHTPKTIRLNLSAVLKERDLNIEDVVKLCGEAGTPITRGTINNLTNPNAKGIYFTSLTALCNGLNVTPGALFAVEEK